MQQYLTDFVRDFHASSNIVIVTGAGLSKASGLPTFRGSDFEAIWKRAPQEMGTKAFFNESPVDSWKWFLYRFEKVQEVTTNPSHQAIKELENLAEKHQKTLTLITQNVDGLHGKAGSKAIEIHGSMEKLRCEKYGCEHGEPYGCVPWKPELFSAFKKESIVSNLPTCSECSGLLRPHVLWFDEYYHSHQDFQFNAAMEAMREADIFLFVGTSFSVGITFSGLEIAYTKRTPVYSLNPEKILDSYGLTGPLYEIQELSETWLPRLVETLQQSPR